MGNNEEMIPIIQDFMSEIMDISREQVVEENGKIDEEAFAYFNDVKAKFKTLESTKEYISEIKSKLPPKEQETKLVLPKLFANMSKSDINLLGGMEQVIKLYEKEGEQKTRELLAILGYDLNSGIKEKGKKQSSVAKEREEKEINKNIKQSVIDYFLGYIKKKYPNLTAENEKIFSERLGEYADHKLEYGGWGTAGFSIDYDPCQELTSAFYSMNMNNFDSGLPIYGVFPIKTHVSMEKGKCATAYSDYGKSEILYITDEYKKELLTSVNTRIMREESKIPQEIKDEFEQEYQGVIGALDIERQPLVKKQEEKQRILDQRDALEVKVKQLIESYSSRVDELGTLGLSESEKEQRKQDIIKEIKQAQQSVKSDKYREQLGQIEEKYGWGDLKIFDNGHKEDLNKELWMRKKYVRYARDEYDRIYEQHRKEHPGEFSFPDTSAVPRELDRLYEEKERIVEYERKQEEKISTKEEQENVNITDEQQKFVQALGKAYAQYMKEHGNIDESNFRNNREEILIDGFSKYFASNYENLTNSAFLIEFENGPMRDIAEERGFRKNHSMFGGLGFNLSTNIAHVKVEEGLIYSVDGMLDEAKIEYGTPEAIQTQIDKFNSEIRFMKDTEENSWNLRRIESLRDSFVSYQRELQGEPVREASLEELDAKKHILEELDRKTTELLQQYDRSNKTNQQKNETDEIEFDD